MTAVEIVNEMWSGTLSTATTVGGGSAGSIIYVALWVAFLLAVAGLIFIFVKKLRG